MERCAEMVVVAGGGSAGMNPLLSTWKSVETDSALRAQSEGFAWTEQAALAPFGHGKQVHRFA